MKNTIIILTHYHIKIMKISVNLSYRLCISTFKLQKKQNKSQKPKGKREEKLKHKQLKKGKRRKKMKKRDHKCSIKSEMK